MRNVRNTGAFALIFAASLLLLLPGCQGPLTPGTTAQTGTVSLTIERQDMSRAINPEIGLSAFDDFEIRFSRAGATDVVLRGATDIDGIGTGTVSAQVELAIASWTVVVTAFISNAVVARSAETTVTVAATGITPATVALVPLAAPGYTGLFTWAFTFPSNVTRVSVDVGGVGRSEDVLGTTSWVYQYPYGMVLPAGDHFVIITLVNDDAEMVRIVSDLHIYGNLTSHFTWVFIDADFAPMGMGDLEDAITEAALRLAETDAAQDGDEVPMARYWILGGAHGNFAAAIVAAQDVVTVGDVDGVEAAIAALGTARTAFIGARRPGRLELVELVAAALLREQTDYTPETWAIFSSALSDAEDALDNPDATRATLGGVYLALRGAYGDLEELVVFIIERGGIRFYAERGTSEETRAAIMAQIAMIPDWFFQNSQPYVLRWTHRAGEELEFEVDPVTGRAIIYSSTIDVSYDIHRAVEYMRENHELPFDGEIIPRTSTDGNNNIIEFRVVPGQSEQADWQRTQFDNMPNDIFNILAARISTVTQEMQMNDNDGIEYTLGAGGRIILRFDWRHIVSAGPYDMLNGMKMAVRHFFPEVEFPLQFDWVMNHDLRDTDFVDWDGSTNQGRLVNVSIERGNNNITPDEIREMITNFDDQSFLAERSAWLVYLRFVSSVPSDVELSGPGVGVNEVRSWTWEVFIDRSLSLRDSLNAAHQLIHNDLFP